MFKLVCTFPNLANICLHKSTETNFNPFMAADKSLSFLQTKQLLTKLFFETLQTYANMGFDASPLYPHSMCQPTTTGLFTHWDLKLEKSRFTTRQNKTQSSEFMVMSYFQRTRPVCIIESFYATGRQKQRDCFSVDDFCSHCNIVFEVMAAFTIFVSVKRFVRPSLKKIFNVVVKREVSRNGDETKYEKKAEVLINCGSVNGGDCTRRAIISEIITEKTSLTDVRLQLSNY